MRESSRKAATGAFWGIGLFFLLWIGMLGSLGELLLLMPVLPFLTFLGASSIGTSLLWRGLAVILSATLFAACGALCGLVGGPIFEELPRGVRNIGLVVIALLILVIIFIGRVIAIH